MRLRVLTFVTDGAQYAEMRESFEANGFTAGKAAFCSFDNCSGNGSDPYNTINGMLDGMIEEFLIVCHQDVRLTPDADYDTLRGQLRVAGGDCGVAGPAGITLDYRQAISINDPWHAPRWCGSWPVDVQALDESFIVVRPGGARLSAALSGFHFYGADLCLSAQRRGWRAVAIDFPLTHLSDGRAGQASVTYRDARRAFRDEVSRHYAFKLVVTSTGEGVVLSRHRWVRTTADRPRVHAVVKMARLRIAAVRASRRAQ